MASPLIRPRPLSAALWPAWLITPATSASPSSSRDWTSGKRRRLWKACPANTAGCCRHSATARSRRPSCPAVIAREWRYTRSTRPSVRVIGRVKFMERYGLSVHQAAALVLARRLLGCSERIPRRWVCPVGNGVQVAFTVPARKRVKHVWTYWGAVSGQLRPALAAQHRLGKRKRKPNPVQAVMRAEARGVA